MAWGSPPLARSELALLLALTGCDLVVGISDDPRPCDAAMFTGSGAPIVEADQFSIDWNQDYGVMARSGLVFEYQLAAATKTPIDLGTYSPSGIALSPEGTGLLFTAVTEPPMLIAAARKDDAPWIMGGRTPAGAYAGTPSADAFGPRHALVRVHDTDTAVQEFVDDSGVWTPIGDPHDVPGLGAPNLTPSGLTMVFSTGDGVYQATRSSRDAWFGKPVMVLPGTHHWPQLLGRCSNLYVVDGLGMLTRYDR
jgi:hypothetical protein